MRISLPTHGSSRPNYSFLVQAPFMVSAIENIYFDIDSASDSWGDCTCNNRHKHHTFTATQLEPRQVREHNLQYCNTHNLGRQRLVRFVLVIASWGHGRWGGDEDTCCLSLRLVYCNCFISGYFDGSAAMTRVGTMVRRQRKFEVNEGTDIISHQLFIWLLPL